MSKRMNFKENFEMLYLRHEYIKRAKKLDPAMVDRYAGIVHTTAKIMFNKLTNFEKVGFAEEDLIAITNVYMLSYMALYSIQTNPKEMEAVLKKRKLESLSDSEILRIDRNRLINFLRQRLHHCGTLCARKARNITVGVDRRGVFAETEKTLPASNEMILDNYKKYGYRKITLKEYKQALEKARMTKTSELVDNGGFKIIRIEILNDGISEIDHRILIESNQSLLSHPPDVILERMEYENLIESKRRKFNNMKPEERNKILNNFLRKNKGDKNLKQELKLAKKMLKNAEAVV